MNISMAKSKSIYLPPTYPSYLDPRPIGTPPPLNVLNDSNNTSNSSFLSHIKYLFQLFFTLHPIGYAVLTTSWADWTDPTTQKPLEEIQAQLLFLSISALIKQSVGILPILFPLRQFYINSYLGYLIVTFVRIKPRIQINEMRWMLLPVNFFGWIGWIVLMGLVLVQVFKPGFVIDRLYWVLIQAITYRRRPNAEWQRWQEWASADIKNGPTHTCNYPRGHPRPTTSLTCTYLFKLAFTLIPIFLPFVGVSFFSHNTIYRFFHHFHFLSVLIATASTQSIEWPLKHFLTNSCLGFTIIHTFKIDPKLIILGPWENEKLHFKFHWQFYLGKPGNILGTTLCLGTSFIQIFQPEIFIDIFWWICLKMDLVPKTGWDRYLRYKISKRSDQDEEDDKGPDPSFDSSWDICDCNQKPEAN